LIIVFSGEDIAMRNRLH